MTSVQAVMYQTPFLVGARVVPSLGTGEEESGEVVVMVVWAGNRTHNCCGLISPKLADEHPAEPGTLRRETHLLTGEAVFTQWVQGVLGTVKSIPPPFQANQQPA